MKGARILIVDDAPNTIELLKRNLEEQGYSIHTSASIADATRTLDDVAVDLVITDMKMPGGSGLELVRHVRENFKDTEVMMITGYATVNGAVQAVKSGAAEYLAKPFTDEELLNAVEASLNRLRVRQKLQDGLEGSATETQGIIGNSKEMQRVFRAIQKAATSDATVLICGESGTGKELVARAIHYSGPRSSRPFVPVSCGAIPEGLLESELFGHVKGAFTGAGETRAGFFQTAEGGSIFLDEISETSLSMQVTLLRVLQDKEIFMVGASRSRKVDSRILAATNKNLLTLAERGLFREDLFYRLNVLAIDLPPLQKRGDDILLLTRHFVDKFAAEAGIPVPILKGEVLQALTDYYWPGNVRELENVIHRLIVMSDANVIDVPDLPPYLRFSVKKPVLHQRLAEMENQHIKNVLNSVEGNKSRAAKILGIDRKTLREKLKRESGRNDITANDQ